MDPFKFETSCGGLVIREDPKEILMVQVKNLAGKIVWTFPKGHVEKGESRRETALREVLEETGWQCRISPKMKRPFEKVRYFFLRNREKVQKQVIWYLMDPLKKTGGRDPNEIRKVKWARFENAFDLVQYPSDKKLLKKLKREANSRRPPRSSGRRSNAILPNRER